MKDLDRDVSLSHAFINYLSASYQGKFAWLNILAQVGHKRADEAEIAKTRGLIDKILKWSSDLEKGEVLFAAAWTQPETFEAKKALDLLEALKPELTELANEVERLLALADFGADLEEVKFLIATFGRYAYSRENYIKGLIEYGKNFKQPEIVNYNTQLLPQAAEDIKLVHLFLNTFKEPGTLEKPFFDVLRFHSRSLGGIFKTYCHDINQLVSQFKGGFNFERAGFTPNESEEWEQAGFGPVPAGYWRAYGFTAPEAGGWLKAGFTDAAVATEWRYLHFPPDHAGPWHALGFPTQVAVLWGNAGFKPEQAMEHIKAGETDPTKITREEEPN